MRWCGTRTLAGAIGLLACTACGGPRLTATELVPGDSRVLVQVDWRAVRVDNVLRTATRDISVESIARRLGIDEQQITEYVAFGGHTLHGVRNGIILSGAFRDKDVVAYLKSQGWREETLQSGQLYSPDSVFYAALTGSGSLVTGSRDAVEAVRDVAERPEDGFVRRAEPKQVLTLLNSRGRLRGVGVVPAGYQHAADLALEISASVLHSAHLGVVGELAKRIGFVRAVGYAIDHEHASLPVQVVALMKDDASAAFVSGSLTLLQGLGSLLPAEPVSPAQREAVRQFTQLRVNRDGNAISIELALAEGDLGRQHP